MVTLLNTLNSAKVEILTSQMKTILVRYPNFCHTWRINRIDLNQ